MLTSGAGAYDQHLLAPLALHLLAHVEAGLGALRLEQRLRPFWHRHRVSDWNVCKATVQK